MISTLMKEIQEQRMKRYFIDACKTLIRGEGYKAVSVRTVAEEAGYSSATLYNYFSDTRELVRTCVDEFIEELREFVFSNSTNLTGNDAVKYRCKEFMKYFMQYPDIFHVIYTEDIYEIRLSSNFRDKTRAVFSEMFSRAEIADDTKADLLELGVTASLLFFLNRFSPKEYRDFAKSYDDTIDHILQ